MNVRPLLDKEIELQLLGRIERESFWQPGSVGQTTQVDFGDSRPSVGRTVGGGAIPSVYWKPAR